MGWRCFCFWPLRAEPCGHVASAVPAAMVHRNAKLIDRIFPHCVAGDGAVAVLQPGVTLPHHALPFHHATAGPPVRCSASACAIATHHVQHRPRMLPDDWSSDSWCVCSAGLLY